jgi:tRNA A37 threonylcarbamoyladenosine synthetase subunit TsaC/SUA5/YrdC
VHDVPEEIRSAVAAVVDGGELPGTASTVIDFTGSDPKVIRDGAVPAVEAIDRVFAALR